MTTLLSTIKTALKIDTVVESKKDIIVKSKDREKAKADLEKYFKAKKIAYKSVFKKSKSASLEVLVVDGWPGDIIFKPIIQKGAGGVSFEKELQVDLENFFMGTELKDLKHSDVIQEMINVVGIKPSKSYKIIHEGSKNQKRSLTFDGTSLSVSNSTGVTLTDITLKDPSGKPMYLSLKMSSSYYILSASIAKYFADPKVNSKLCEYLGMDGQMMGGFGPEFMCITKKPNYSKAKRNIEDFLAETYGSKVVIIHKKRQDDVVVDDINTTNRVAINNLNGDSYVYPVAGVRKYAAIKFKATINEHDYNVSFQFRGTTASDVGPKYLRILMERI